MSALLTEVSLRRLADRVLAEDNVARLAATEGCSVEVARETLGRRVGALFAFGVHPMAYGWTARLLLCMVQRPTS